MPSRRNPSMSDRKLRQLLKQLRESPAAPQDFRAEVLGRLADDGLLPSRSVAKVGLRERLSAWLRPASLGLAAAGALALALVLRPVPAPQTVAALPPAGVPLAAPAASARASHSRTVAPAGLSPARAAQVPSEDMAVVSQPVITRASEGVGAAPQAKAQASVHVAGVTATVGPAARDISKPYPKGSSEVRNNVVRYAQAEMADIHFSFVTSGHVRVDILDRLGRQVAVLFDGQLSADEYDGGIGPGRPAGAQPCSWCLWNSMTQDSAVAASGIYLLRIQTPDYVHIHKLMLIK